MRNARPSWRSWRIASWKEQEAAYVQQGRSVSRRVNRFEYQNVLRDLLHDPTLKVADQLPLDGEVHGFAKVGSALDVSHVQVDAYLDVAELALRRAVAFPAEKPKSTTPALLRPRTRADVGWYGEWRMGTIFSRAGGLGYQPDIFLQQKRP